MAGTRRDIDTLSENELSDYIHALDVLRRRSAANSEDRSGYDYQARLHNDGFVGPCEHGNDRFFPWHRAHLHYFEQLLQAADPPRTANVTIPYWDWIHPQKGRKFPAAFDVPGLSMEGRNVSANFDLPADTVEIVTTERTWHRFGGYPNNSPDGDFGRLEGGPHNFMHGTFIDGRMGEPETAAEDPIYFSFHAFIDLLWFEWQRRNSMPPVTSPEVVLRGFEDQPMHRLGDFADPDALALDYEYTDRLRDAFAAEPAPARELRTLLAAESLEPAFDAPMAEVIRSGSALDFAVPAVAETPATVVRLQLNIPTAGSYTVYAYLHPAGVRFERNAPDFTDRWRVGYAAVWRGHDMPDGGDHAAHAHHPSSMTLRFDVTDVLASVPDASDLVLTLDWVPARNHGRALEVMPLLADEIEIEDLALERFD